MEFNAQRYWIVRKRIINGVIFLLCFILIFTGLNQLLINKSHRRTLQYILYEAPENYYDALYVGGSHMNGAIAPSVLLESDGIRGFNLATGGQEFRVTYYLLKEVLKRQSPRLVVLDVYYMLSANRYGVEAYNHYVVDAMQFSKNKIDLIQNCIAPEDRLSFYIPFLKYHSRWNDLNKDDFTWKETSPADGWGAGTLQYDQEMSFSDWSDECAALPAGMEEYLDKFIALSQEMGFTLVLANFPNDYDWTKDRKIGWKNRIKV